MFRELFLASVALGGALAIAQSATAAPSYNGDVPGMAQNVRLGDACTSWDRFIFGRGAEGQPMACHWINNQIYIPGGWDSPPEGVGFWVYSPKLYGVQTPGSPCPGSQAAAQSPDGLPMLCLGAQGWQPGFLKVGPWGNGSSFEPAG